MLTSHRLTFTGLALACLTGFATAQGTASEIPAMTCPSTEIDMDNVAPAGPCFARNCPVTVAQINAAGSNGPGLLSSITCTRNPSTTTGTYEVFSSNGRALKCATTTSTSTLGTFLIDPPSPPGTPTSTFLGVDYCLSFQFNHTQFGLEVGNWFGPLDFEFFDGPDCTGNMVARFTSTASSTFFSTAPLFFQVTGDCFKSVAVRAPDIQRSANFVITEIWTEREGTGNITDPTTAANTCIGSNGMAPTLTAVAVTATPQIPEKCERIQFVVANGIPGSPAQIVVNGPGPLAPVSLGVIGGDPQCFVKIPLAPAPVFLAPVNLDGQGSFTFGTTLGARLCGVTFNVEYWLADFGKPQPIKATTTNQLSITVQ